LQIREEVGFTKGRIIVRGKLVSRGKAKRADYVLYFKPNIPIALIEAKDNSHSVGDGIQQALEYATTLEIPFVFSSNGDGFVFHDRTGTSAEKEANLALDAFPSADTSAGQPSARPCKTGINLYSLTLWSVSHPSPSSIASSPRSTN
jgi:type I restriction enzyme R subunit